MSPRRTLWDRWIALLLLFYPRAFRSRFGAEAFAVRSMNDWVERGLARPRFGVALLALFAGLATLLAGVGIYGVMAFVVTLRTRELRVRLALGAQPGSLLWMMLQHSLTLAGVGLGAGLAAGMASAKALEATFGGARAFDPVVSSGVAALVLTVATAAAYLPARRAMRVDPVEALRGECARVCQTVKS